jgi:hypothetical protein
MANTYVDYTGDGNETSFAYTFEVLSGRQQDHIIVGVDDSTTTGGKFEVVDPADYTIDASAGTITFDTAPESGARIRIRRDSDASTLLVDFKNGTVLPERDLDLAYLHNLFLNEEIEEGSGKNTLVKNEDGNYDADGVRLVNLADPEDPQDAVTKGYADNRYVDVAGDTMTGSLAMSDNNITGVNSVQGLAAPTSDNHAANKKYVDDEVATEAAARIAGDALKVNKAGDSMSGNLTMTSPAKVIQNQAPTSGDDLTNKTYVDGVVATEASNRAAGDLALTNSKVSRSGDTMSGNLNMATKKVTGLGAPSANTDAATKTYVDKLISEVDLSVAPSFTKLTGNGTTTDFSLTFNTNGVVSTAMLVTIDGAVQDPDDYLILGGSDEIQFTTAPPNNSEILVIERGFRPKTDLPAEYDWGFVADTVVTASYTYGQI